MRLRLWKRELQRFANETGLAVTVAHLPPGTSKWNRIEHRLFAHISQNWRGKPLVSHQVIVQLIGATTTQTGLAVRCELDANCYPKGIKITAAEMATLAITRYLFHGEWNYTISPNQQPLAQAISPAMSCGAGSVGTSSHGGPVCSARRVRRRKRRGRRTNVSRSDLRWAPDLRWAMEMRVPVPEAGASPKLRTGSIKVGAQTRVRHAGQGQSQKHDRKPCSINSGEQALPPAPVPTKRPASSGSAAAGSRAAPGVSRPGLGAAAVTP